MNFQKGSDQPIPMTAGLIPKYYLITVMLKDRTIHTGIRKNEVGDVDACYLLFRGRAEDSYGRDNIIYFQCVQLSKHSDEFKRHFHQNNLKAIKRVKNET